MSTENTYQSQYKTWFWAALACLSIFRFWFAGRVPLTGDEAYHWEWSRHLAWGYYDHPPLVAYMIRLCTWLGGTTLRSIRAGAVILSALSTILVYKLAKEISEESALPAGILTLVLPIFSVGALITTTDTPHAFFWLLSVYCFYKAIFSTYRRWWYLGGIALGLAFISKFFALFIPLGLLAFLILAPGQRRWLTQKEPYLAMLIALAIFSPFIWWNATHDWATFTFNLTARHKAPQLTLKFLGEYLGGQALAIFPGILILYLYGLYISVKRYLKEKNEKHLYLFCTTAPLWLLFLKVSLYQRVGLHWPIATYFSGIIIIALLLPQSPNWYKKLYKIGIVGSLLISVFLYALALNPQIIPWNIKYAGRPDKIKSSDLNEFYGWEELGQRVSSSFAQISAHTPSFIGTNSYALSGQVAFYTPQNPFVYMIGVGSVHGQNYRYWQDMDKLKGHNALLIFKEGKNPEEYLPLFEQVEEEEPLKIYLNGQVIRSFLIYRCYNYKGKQ